MIDANGLSDNQRNGIRIWTEMIRKADPERAVRILTRIVTNLAGDKLALDTLMAETKDKPLN